MSKLIDKEFAKQIISDLDRIKETLQEIQGSDKVEKKEQRKLATILLDAYIDSPTVIANEAMPYIAKAAIDAVIECFDEWINNFQQPGPFPEYLKEKLGNEKEKML